MGISFGVPRNLFSFYILKTERDRGRDRERERERGGEGERERGDREVNQGSVKNKQSSRTHKAWSSSMTSCKQQSIWFIEYR